LSAEAGEQSPLIETVLTTTGSDGVVNCAAMGVRWGEEELVFWPFDATRTLRNLRVHGEAVVHLTDDVLLFVQAALGLRSMGDDVVAGPRPDPDDHAGRLHGHAAATEPAGPEADRVEHAEVQPRRRGDDDPGHVRPAT